MAEHKYISLKDVLKEHPNLNYMSDPNIESGDEHEPDSASMGLGNPNSPPPSPPLPLLGFCLEHEGYRAKKAGQARPRRLKHSRSDDPLVYVDKDDAADSSFDDLQSFSEEMKNFSWEERTHKSSPMFFFDSDDEAEEEEDEAKEKKK